MQYHMPPLQADRSSYLQLDKGKVGDLMNLPYSESRRMYNLHKQQKV